MSDQSHDVTMAFVVNGETKGTARCKCRLTYAEIVVYEGFTTDRLILACLPYRFWRRSGRRAGYRKQCGWRLAAGELERLNKIAE